MMYALILVSIDLRTEFEVPASTLSKNVVGVPKFKNGSRDLDHAHLGLFYPWYNLPG